MEAALPELAVLRLPPADRDSVRVAAVASFLGSNSVIELPFLRSLDSEELVEACRLQLRLDHLRPGEAICLQGEEADSAYVVLSGTVSCHIRKDLQQTEPALAYGALVAEFAEAAEAKAAASERASERRDRRQSVFGAAAAMPAAAPTAATPPASAAAGGGGGPAPAPAFLQLLQRRRSTSPSSRRYLMVPGADAGQTPGAGGAPAGATPTSAGGGGGGGAGMRGWKRASNQMLTSSAAAASLRSKLSQSLGPSVAVLGVGDSFGEASLLHAASRRAASAVCNSHCAILVCPRGALNSATAAERESKLLDFLKGVPCLMGCSNASLTQLLRTSKRRNYTLGERLTTEGGKGSTLLLLSEGAVALSVASGTHMHPNARAHPTAAAKSQAAAAAASAAAANSAAAATAGSDVGAAIQAMVETSNASRLTDTQGGAHTPRCSCDRWGPGSWCRARRAPTACRTAAPTPSPRVWPPRTRSCC